LFPWDEHRLTISIELSFNVTLDTHPSVGDLPSQNYEGRFLLAGTGGNPSRYELGLEIKHPSSFVTAVALMLYSTIISLYALSFTMIALIALVALSKKPRDLLPNLIRVSSAIIFFVPAFEIAFNSLKSPLPLVFSDILIIPVIPLNALIIVAAILLHYFFVH
jgi:hypothetical protein